MAQQRALGQQGLISARVRRARPSDAAAIARMANALNRDEGLPQRFTPAIIRRDAFGPRRCIRIVVAEAEHRLVGYAATIVGYNTDLAAPELFMLDLFVLPRWRGRGIGRALVVRVARETVRRRFVSLQWGVRASNTRAKRFYRGLGARLGKGTGVALLTGRALSALSALAASD